MRKRLCLPAVLSALLALPALAGEQVEFHADVMPLLAGKCSSCHADGGVSFAFDDPERTYALRAAIASAVAERRMPPWLAEPGHQEYVGDYSLSADERALIADWAAAGFPRGEPGKAALAGPAPLEFDADISFSVLPEDGYLPNQERKDDYRCFLIEWPFDEDRYVTGFRATPGNLRVAHHLVNFVVGPEAADILRTVSAEEEGPGYQCFGGAIPDSLGSEQAREALEARFPGAMETLRNNNFWLSHWAPGMYGEEFPGDTGILVRPGSLIVVQMHYYSAFAPGESDSGTAMHFKVAEHVEKPSINAPLTNYSWLASKRNGTMTIPSGESATFEASVNFERLAGYAARVLEIAPDDIAALELRSANIHMHAFGASGETSLLHASGRKETLLRIPRWDLDWQRDFLLRQSKIIPRDDFGRARLTVECTFANHTGETVFGGYGSYDEMCFNFSYVSVIREGQEVAAAKSTKGAAGDPPAPAGE